MDVMKRLESEAGRIFQTHHTRRMLLRRAVALSMLTSGGVALLAACRGAGETPETSPREEPQPTVGTVAPSSAIPTASPAPTEQAPAKKGGTATVVVAADPASWDLSKSTWPTWQAVHFLYDRLITFDDQEQLLPGLASSWDISDDGMEYVLHLRDGVKFHDGTPFNAEAVKFNIQRHLDKPDSAFYTSFDAVDQVEPVDELTVRIALKQLRVDFIYTLSLWGALQLSPKAYTELGDNYAQNPVGTGPFKFQSYEPGSSIRYVRNDEYWGGAPLLDSIVVRIIPEPSVQITELEAGTADVIGVEPKDVETLKEKGFIIESVISPGTQFISLNVSQEPTSELAVRKAIAHAIDRDTIIEKVLFGFAEKSRAGVTSNSPYYFEDVPMIEYNPEMAAKILDEAGWVMGPNGIRQRDGKPLFLNILSTDFGSWGLFNEIFQEQLKKVGFDSKITSLEWNAYLDQWRENQGGWNLTFHSQGSLLASTSVIQASWIPDSYWTITQIDDARDPELVKLREELQSIADELEVILDMEKRKELAKRAQIFFQENVLAVWLWHLASITAINPRLKGYRLSHHGRIIELEKAWVE